MNADFSKSLQVPRPKVRSHLTIKVQSKLMPTSGYGPKPPVAPKPKPWYQARPQGELCSQQSIGNGEVTCAAKQTDRICEMAKKNHSFEEKKEAQDVSCDNNLVGTDKAKAKETEFAVESQKRTPALDTDSDVDSTSSDETIKADDLISCAEDENTDNDSVRQEEVNNTDDETLSRPSLSPIISEDEAWHNEDEQGDPSEVDKVCSCAAQNPLKCFSQTHSFKLGCEDRKGTSEKAGDCLPCSLLTNENELEAEGFAFGFAVLPTVTEEYPYDVIGLTDEASDTCESCDPAETGETEVWQPERATKDLSGCFRFTSSTEDVFGPYSVIEAVPGNTRRTAAPEWSIDVTDNTATTDEAQTQVVSHQEPYYVSSDDVDKLEDKQTSQLNQIKQETERLDEPQDKTKDADSADEYADIDNSLCPKTDGFEQSGCVSSEDYVEIGEEEDEEEKVEKKHIKAKSAKERTAKREQAFHRKSCQPRLRLCNITVPADLDLGRTPELTNRVVFAHTTEAFEEDIEELDCHIVPYYEDTDSDSEEHIYEEAIYEPEGENFTTFDRKMAVARSRSYSGKLPNNVPETVPEESGTEGQTHDYYTVTLDKHNEPISVSQKPGVESIDQLSLDTSVQDEPKDEVKLKRKEDNLSLPCVITSSGSFSYRVHQSSSGVSTPTSLVDIPPPFDFVYITKRPVTKSSPALLVQHETSEKPKKKKSSFKRFFALKFKKRSDSKGSSDVSVRSSRSSSASSHHGPSRVIELDNTSTGSSPQPAGRNVNAQQLSSDRQSSIIPHAEHHGRKADRRGYTRDVSRVKSFKEDPRCSVMPLPLNKPRSISFPSADTSDYENIPALSSDYENIQIPGRPVRSHTVTEFFENPSRPTAPCNENDGYVDMNSFPGIDREPGVAKTDQESAYTEPFPMNSVSTEPSIEEDHGRTSEEEDGILEQNYDKQIEGRSRAFYIAKELVDSERLHVSALKHIQVDFRLAVTEGVDEEGQPVLEEQRLADVLGVLPLVYNLHSSILADMEERFSQWEENQKVVDAILSRREDFVLFDTYICQYDRSMSILQQSCANNPCFASIVKKFEIKGPEETEVPLKHQLLQVIVRILQYRMLLTDYLNNLSPDSKEYDDTQAALVIVSEVADQANDNLKQGENLLRLVHIEYSVKGKRELLKPGRIFVKEGTLMKVSRKNRQPRHLFLMNDIMLYTYPQQDGKYRLKNTLSLSGMKVSKPMLENVLNCLKIEVPDITIILSASSLAEREDWFHTLSRAIADHAAGLCTFGGPCSEAREKLWMALGETAPVLVSISQAMMCMNCTTDFSLTLRRHHCYACGKVVCRSCSKNRYALKYLKDRMAKVCNLCYAELEKKGGSTPAACDNTSLRSQRASRPLSTVFQSLQTPSLWKLRKSTSNLSQVSLGVDSSTMSGSLQRRKKSKRRWKRLWFLLKDKVLYTFTAREDKVASESLPLQGFTVKLIEKPEGEDNVFCLYYKKTLCYSFKADDQHTARRWVNAIEEATVL